MTHIQLTHTNTRLVVVHMGTENDRKKKQRARADHISEIGDTTLKYLGEFRSDYVKEKKTRAG